MSKNTKSKNNDIRKYKAKT
ncbi:hypothetical protein, partial [Escherichia coli]